MRLVDLTEHRQAYLFHGTPIWNLLNILKEDTIVKGRHWGRDGEPDGIRFSRDYDTSRSFIHGDEQHDTRGGILVLDVQALKHNHKIIPYSDSSSWTSGKTEFEEVVVANNIKPLSRFLVEIWCLDNFIKEAEQAIVEGFGPKDLDIDAALELLYALQRHPKRVNKI